MKIFPSELKCNGYCNITFVLLSLGKFEVERKCEFIKNMHEVSERYMYSLFF